MRSTEEIGEDLKPLTELAEGNMDAILLSLPGKQARLVDDLKEAEVLLSRLLKKQRKLTGSLWRYYNGEPVELPGKPKRTGKMPVSIVQGFIDSDDELLEIRGNIDNLKAYVKYVENQLKFVSDVRWIIKLYTDRKGLE